MSEAPLSIESARELTVDRERYMEQEYARIALGMVPEINTGIKGQAARGLTYYILSRNAEMGVGRLIEKMYPGYKVYKWKDDWIIDWALVAHDDK